MSFISYIFEKLYDWLFTKQHDTYTVSSKNLIKYYDKKSCENDDPLLRI